MSNSPCQGYSGGPADIPAICRSARIILGLTQAQLAERLGVEPSTVSRWETGKIYPGPDILNQFHDIILKSDPLRHREFLEQSMVPRYVHGKQSIEDALIISRGLGQAYGMQPEKLAKDVLWWIGPSPPKLLGLAQRHPDFDRAAYFKASWPAPLHDGMWWHASIIPFHAQNAVHWEGVLMPFPADKELEIVTYRDAKP